VNLPAIQPVLIVGAGPTGMTAALDLAHYGIPSIVLDDDNELSAGSRAIAYHQSALAVWEKLGAVEPMLKLGIAWWVRHTYRGERELYVQDFGQPSPGYLPRYINLPQKDVERFLLERIMATALIDMRWEHRVSDFAHNAAGVTLTVETPQGRQYLSGQYVLACDGARSSMRKLLDLHFPGQTFNDYFLIADVRADLHFPPEPRFFFDHPTNPGHTILIHPQPAGIWRIDWQIGSSASPEMESTPEKMDKRIRALIGDTPYEVVWLSTYRFHQRLLAEFEQHGRVFFVGDSAHLVAPFGARGLNSAIQDVENLAWKLAYVLKGLLPQALLETYQLERWAAQAENQRVTRTTMRFMAPDTFWLRLRHNAILWLSGFFAPARKWVDSGKMSIPFVYQDTPLNIPDRQAENWRPAPALGAKLPDLPISSMHAGQLQSGFLRQLFGSGFVALYFVENPARLDNFFVQLASSSNGVPLKVYPVMMTAVDGFDAILDPQEKLALALAAQPGTLYLVRPDGHIALRRRKAAASDLIDYFEKLGRLKNEVSN